MSTDLMMDACRQVEICDACRYYEGYCSVFPAITRQRAFSDEDLTQLANLCHNCRGCYYACQYTEPHEFALNLLMVLAEVRGESYKAFAWPQGFAPLFERYGGVIALGLAVAIFSPAFLVPLAAISISVAQY